MLVPVAQHREHRLAGTDLDILAQSAAAAILARTAAVRDEFDALDEDRIIGLVNFDRNIGAVDDRAEAFGAVLHRPPAIPAEHQVVHYELLTRAVVDAAEIGVA